jgi:hypothetical protein
MGWGTGTGLAADRPRAPRGTWNHPKKREEDLDLSASEEDSKSGAMHFPTGRVDTLSDRR